MRVALCTSLHLDHGRTLRDGPDTPRSAMQDFVPLGLLALKAKVEALALPDDVEVVEVNGLINSGALPAADSLYGTIAERLLANGTEVVGLMTDADSLHHTVAIGKELERRAPGVHVCAGGPAATPIARRFLETFPQFGAVVRGEGDLTFPDYLRALRGEMPIASVEGLTWRAASGVRENQSRPLVDDLDTLPIPRFEAAGNVRTAPIYLDVGRGCPFLCRFCATAPFWSRKYRMKSIERIIEELTILRERHGRTSINFSHDIFTADTEWTRQFCGRLASARLGVQWTCSTRTDVIDEDLLGRMSSAGCVEIYYGIETGSPAMQKAIDKNLDLRRAREIVAATAACGIRPVTGFIVGYPMETRETLDATLERFFDFLAVGGYRGHIFTLSPYHQSPLYEKSRESVGPRAQYLDVSLRGGDARFREELIGGHRDVFANSFRYSTHAVPDELVAAAEEISSVLVLLKSVWPRVLRLYESPLAWYERWTTWIGGENARRGIRSDMPRLGDAADMLRFLDGERSRLGCEDPILRDLLRYERLKLEAGMLPDRSTAASGARRLTLDATVAPGRPFRRIVVATDLARLDAAGDGWDGDGTARCIVGIKEADGSVTTLQLAPLAAALLEECRAPTRAAELRGVLGEREDDDALLGVISGLVEWELLVVG